MCHDEREWYREFNFWTCIRKHDRYLNEFDFRFMGLASAASSARRVSIARAKKNLNLVESHRNLGDLERFPNPSLLELQ